MQTHVVETALGPVEFSDAGDGESILYFHGTGVTGDAMVAIESRLTDDGFRLVAPHRPGYGLTPLQPNTTAAACSEVATALLDSLGVENVSVMGSSGGAAFALSFAVNQPSRTKSLVLLCPQLHRWDTAKWLPVASRWTLPFLKRPMLRKLLLKAYRYQLARMSAIQLLRMEAGDRFSDIADDPAAREICEMSLAAMLTGTQFAGFENDMRIFVTEDMLGHADQLTSPTIVIHDICDPMAPVAHSDWFVSVVPECQRVRVHTAGHLIWVGPDSDVMHTSRVAFLKAHMRATASPP